MCDLLKVHWGKDAVHFPICLFPTILFTVQYFLLVKYSGSDSPLHYFTVMPEKQTEQQEQHKTRPVNQAFIILNCTKVQSTYLIPINRHRQATIISSGRMFPITNQTTPAEIVEGCKHPPFLLVITFCCIAGTSTIMGILDDKKQTSFAWPTLIYLFSCQNYVSLSNDST